MVLAAHGIRKNQTHIVNELPMLQAGVRLGDLGVYLLKQGFGVTLFSWIPGIRPHLRGTSGSPQDLAKALRLPLTASARTSHRRYWKIMSNSLLRFAKAGGKIRLEPIHLRHIDWAIRRGLRLIVNINPRILGCYGTSDSGHYVVPVGLTGPDSQVSRPVISYMDPLYGREKQAYADDFIHACHLWEGGGLIIHPPNFSPQID